jgi:hypothetical protein
MAGPERTPSARTGRDEALRRNLFATRCPGHIRSGIEILDALTGESP